MTEVEIITKEMEGLIQDQLTQQMEVIMTVQCPRTVIMLNII